MNKQKYFTPTIAKKLDSSSSKKQQDTETYTTENYNQRIKNANYNLMPLQKIKSNPSFSLDKMSTRSVEIAKSSLITKSKMKQMIKLPSIQNKTNNPETIDTENFKTVDRNKSELSKNKMYYLSNLMRCLKKHETTYLMNLYRQHFYQCIQILRFGRSIKLAHPKKENKLPQMNKQFKTVFLDMDETLIHCDERSNNYTVKLNFPLDRGGILAAGVRIRPFCQQFLKELSEIAEIIIFTASSSSYADVILDHLDPEKKYISHRLYRHNCTLQKGFYLKDLRTVNRKLQNVVLVDNSPYCHILQPENGIPIVPFYHYANDRQLEHLLQFLKVVINSSDTRKVILETFKWDKYITDVGDPRKLFFKYNSHQE